MEKRARLALVALLLGLTASGPGEALLAEEAGKDAKAKNAVDAAAPDDTLVLGTFRLKKKKPVIDGDTIKVEGLDKSLRLLCIDTEEIFHKPERRGMSAANFPAYAKAMRGDGRPAKYGTPMGEVATVWARRFFEKVKKVRLERDEVGRKRGYFDRHLVYVFAKKDGVWINYNLAAVRAGMAPYFVKYGRCGRFDAEFVAAQKEAQIAHRGIWSDALYHYPDYDERLTWWEERAATIDRFRARSAKDADLIDLMADDGLERALDRLGDTVTVFSSFGDARLDKKPYLVPLSHRRNKDFLIVAFDDQQLAKIGLEKWKGKLVHVRGKVSQFRGRPQMKASDVEKIWVE